MNHLWSYVMDCGRNGLIEGLFVASNKEILEMIGKEVRFGEVLGKGSNVKGIVNGLQFTKKDLPSDIVEELSKGLGNTWSGYNPMYYIEFNCDECGKGYFKECLGGESYRCPDCVEKEQEQDIDISKMLFFIINPNK